MADGLGIDGIALRVWFGGVFARFPRAAEVAIERVWKWVCFVKKYFSFVAERLALRGCLILVSGRAIG
jgi:hypothetical protein